MEPRSSTYWTQTAAAKLLGTRYPIIQGPFGGGLSSTALAAAVSNAGGLGSFGAHLLGPEQIRDTVAEMRSLTQKPFAMNFWVPQAGEPRDLEPAAFAKHVERLRPHLQKFGLGDPSLPSAFVQDFAAQVEAVLEARPPVVSFIMGVPPRHALVRAKDLGIVAMGTATTVDEAVELDRAGVDLVVASGNDDGGHRAAFLRPAPESLVGTLSLVPQVVDAVRCPVIAAGGIADGRGIAAALALGAAAVQIGTAFLVCDESAASAAYRAAVASPRARTTVLTRVYSGRLGRGIPNTLFGALTKDEGEIPNYPVQNWLTLPLRRAAALAGDAEYLSLWCGQSAGLANARPAAELVAALVAETDRTLAGLSPIAS